MFGGRSRRRGASASGGYLYYFTIGTLIIAATAVLAVSIIPSLSFSSVALDRSGNIGIADESSSVVGLDVASSVTEGSTDRLVTVTNNLDVDAIITVSLNNPNQGTLYYGGSPRGDSYTLSLPPGGAATFDVEGTIPSQASDWQSSDCSVPEASVEMNGWNVTFYCATYDAGQDHTQYRYGVEAVDPPGQMHDLSHIVYGFEDGFDPTVISTSPEAESEEGPDEGDIKTDPVTGVYGLKFDDEISKTGAGQIYTFTIDGFRKPTDEDHGLKAGPDTFTVNLPGPGALPGSSKSGQKLHFTVKMDAPELNAELVRDTDLEPEPEPDPEQTPTEDDDSEDDDSEDDDGGGGGPPQGNPGGGNSGRN